MNAREEARFDAVKRVGTFGIKNASDFTTPVPPALAVTPGQTQAKQLIAALNTPGTGLIAMIAKNSQSQQAGTGDYHGGSTAKSVLRDALFLEWKGFNRSAGAIAKAQKKPEIMDKFRMPYGVGDEKLTAKTMAMADAAGALASDFVTLGHEPTFAADLKAHVKAFDEADDSKDAGEQGQAGATAAFGPMLDEAMTKVGLLDAFMHNFYKSNAEKMGEWHTASHVERQTKAKKKDQPDKPTPGPEGWAGCEARLENGRPRRLLRAKRERTRRLALSAFRPTS